MDHEYKGVLMGMEDGRRLGCLFKSSFFLIFF
jgi:hypothetical protein